MCPDYISVLPYYIVLAVKAQTRDLLCPLTVSVLFRGHNNFDTPNMKESEWLFMPYIHALSILKLFMTINVILNKTKLTSNVIHFDNNYSMENFLNFVNNEKQALSVVDQLSSLW